MTKKVNRLEEIGNKNSFKVPEGYFDGLTDKIMSQLPEKVQEQKVVSLWERVQPFLYLAAMFAGIWLMLNLFVNSPQKMGGLNLTSSADIEEFYQYYEDQLVNNMYSESFYFDDNEIDDGDFVE
jgi:hypothetical protein